MAPARRRVTLAPARKEVIRMPTEVLIKDEHRVLEAPPRAAPPTRPDELRTAERRYVARVRRLKVSVAYFVRPTADRAALRMQRLKFHVAAWLLGMVV
jgi:hypothetical protein